MKLHISYKREGDGFQCNAVCDCKYTYSFWYRHGPPQTLGPEFKDLELSPTAHRVVWLAQRLPNKWTRIYMDNLFNSVKLYSALYRAEALAHGVAHTNGWGVPKGIIQKVKKQRLCREASQDDEGNEARQLTGMPRHACGFNVQHKAGPSSINGRRVC